MTTKIIEDKDMKLIIGSFLRNLDDEYKSKVVTDKFVSNEGTVIIVYKFWNQVGNKERVITLDKLLENHIIEN